MAHEPIKDDAEFARALERVGTTIESRIRWLLKLYDQHGTIDHFTEEQMKALRCEMAVFIDPMFDPKKGPVSWIAVRGADRSARQVCQGLQVLTRGEEWTCQVSTEYRLQIPRGEPLRVVRAPRRSPGNQMIPAVHEVLLALRDRVRRCYRENCSRLFIRTKGQQYCSKQCAQKDRMARFREGRRQRRARITGTGVDTQSPTE